MLPICRTSLFLGVSFVELRQADAEAADRRARELVA